MYSFENGVNLIKKWWCKYFVKMDEWMNEWMKCFFSWAKVYFYKWECFLNIMKLNTQSCIKMGLHIIRGTWFWQLTFTVHHSIGVYNNVKIKSKRAISQSWDERWAVEWSCTPITQQNSQNSTNPLAWTSCILLSITSILM